jgi:hypothetical protein
MSAPLISRSERSYIQSAIQAPSPRRADGRGPHDFRAIALETGVAPLSNGSARVSIGIKTAPEGQGGTEVLAAVKLEVESASDDGAGDNGRLVCSVSWCVIFRFFFFFRGRGVTGTRRKLTRGVSPSWIERTRRSLIRPYDRSPPDPLPPLSSSRKPRYPP